MSFFICILPEEDALGEACRPPGEESGEEKGEGGADGLPEDQELQGEGEDREKSAEKKGKLVRRGTWKSIRTNWRKGSMKFS